jgi:hypothetical protein
VKAVDESRDLVLGDAVFLHDLGSGMAGGAGAFSKMGGPAPTGFMGRLGGAMSGGSGGNSLMPGESGGMPSGGGGWQNQLGGILGGMAQGRGQQQPMQEMQRYPPPGGQAMPRRDMRNPNLSNPIEQGRREALTRNPRRQERLRRRPTEY